MKKLKSVPEVKETQDEKIETPEVKKEAKEPKLSYSELKAENEKLHVALNNAAAQIQDLANRNNLMAQDSLKAQGAAEFAKGLVFDIMASIKPVPVPENGN